MYMYTYIDKLIYTLSDVKPVFDKMSLYKHMARGTYNEVPLILVYAGHSLSHPGVAEQVLEPVHPLQKYRPHLYWSRGDLLQHRQS